MLMVNRRTSCAPRKNVKSTSRPPDGPMETALATVRVRDAIHRRPPRLP